MKKYKWFTCALFSLSIILFFFSTSFAYYLSYDMGPLYSPNNAVVSLNSDGFSVTDAYDQYSESSWQVLSAVDDGNGGVNVTYANNQDPWDSYGANISFSFRIQSDYGNLNPELVTVDGWGELLLDHEVVLDPTRFAAACCWGSDVIAESPIAYLSSPSEDFNGSYNLYTNTDYYFTYNSELYVESWIRDPLHHFDTWEEYSAFINETGGAGGAHTSSQGFLDYNLVLSSTEQPSAPVPEPSTLFLLAMGTIGVYGKYRKRKISI